MNLQTPMDPLIKKVLIVFLIVATLTCLLFVYAVVTRQLFPPNTPRAANTNLTTAKAQGSVAPTLYPTSIPTATLTAAVDSPVWVVDTLWQEELLHNNVMSDVVKFTNQANPLSIRYGVCLDMGTDANGNSIPDPIKGAHYTFDDETDIFSPLIKGTQTFQYLPGYTEEKLE